MLWLADVLANSELLTLVDSLILTDSLFETDSDTDALTLSLLLVELLSDFDTL